MLQNSSLFNTWYRSIQRLWVVSAMLISWSCQSQTIHLFDFREAYDSAQIAMTPKITVPSEDAGYTLLMPSSQPKGLIVSFNSGRDTAHVGYEMRLYQPATRHQLAIAFVTTGNRFEFLFEEKRYRQLEKYIQEIMRVYDLSAERLHFVGMSLAGTRALKFALWCIRSNSKIRPRSVTICDAPLDFVRFWDAGNIAIRHQINPIAANEASWVNTMLEKHLGGTPEDNLSAYVDYSPFYKGFGIDKRLENLEGIAIRAYTEPDVQWWMRNRKKNYYGMNAIDAAGLINQLQILGHPEAELITTLDEGIRPDGTRHPHTWGIVDNEELVLWMLGLSH